MNPSRLSLQLQKQQHLQCLLQCSRGVCLATSAAVPCNHIVLTLTLLLPLPPMLTCKQVDPPQERGVSHERKLKSYAAEAAFYSHYADRVLSSGSAAAIAEALLVDVAPPTHFLFVLRDLRVDFPEHKYTLDKQVGAGL